jgi:hypothetical protein
MNNCVVTENNCRTGADGYTGAGGNGGNGGGIFNSGTVILQNCSISNNSSGQGTDASSSEGLISIDAPGAPGGSGGAGAGIYNIGDVSLNSCTVNGNSTGPGGAGFAGGSGGNGGAGGNGGGIFNLGTLRLNTCTISGNLCGTGGTGGEGLVVAGGTGGTGGNGGGIYNAGPCDSTSCTIVLNSAGAGGTGGYPDDYGDPGASGGIGGCGGGILNDASVSNVTIRNTLIALNSASPGGLAGGSLSGSTGNPGLDGSGPDGAGDFTSQGFNLIGEVDGIIGFTNAMNADLVGNIANPINPLLGPLQMNGGATFTHALLLGTPAVDQGDSFGIPTDQRGHPRPHGYSTIPNAVGGDGTDIGAFELDLPILNLTKSATNIVISWDTNSSGYILQSTTDLILSNSWTTVTAPVAIAGHQFQVTNSIDAAGTFFRLRTN